MARGRSNGLEKWEEKIDLSQGGKAMVWAQHQPGFKLPVKKILEEALPGRSLNKTSKRQGWIYLDSWYMIGPWSNFGEINWSRTHEPEQGFDLSASYDTGKNSRPLKWKFFQSSKVNCRIPEYEFDSTYYAYTELQSDEEQEVLMAVAADDAAKLWVNNRVVYSREGISDWHLDEAIFKVRLQAGINRIRMRIENGPGKSEFSLCLCPDK